MTSYLVWLDNAVLGPFSLDDATGLRGFGAQTLVCPESREGASHADWRPARHFEDIAQALERGPARESLPNHSYAALAVAELEAEFARKNAGHDEPARLLDTEQKARALLLRLRRLEHGLDAQSVFALPGRSLRRRQAAAALSAELNLRAEAVVQILEGIYRRKAELGMAAATPVETPAETPAAAPPAQAPRARRYLVWLNKGVFGPFGAGDLAVVRGFGLKTLVCPDDYGGTAPGDWRPAGRVNEIFEAVGRALATDKDGILASAMRRDEGLSEAGRAVAALQSEVEPKGGAEDSLARVAQNRAKAESMLSRLRRYDGDLQSAAEEPGRPLRMRQSAAAARMDVRLQTAAVGHVVDRLRQFEAELHGREREQAEKILGAPAPSVQSAAAPAAEPEPAQYTFLGRLAALTGKWALIAVSAFFSLRYLIWRGLYTLNYASNAHLLISAMLLAAEVYGFISVMLFFLQVLAPKPVKPVPIEGELPEVDVFVTIYNEPLEILEQTLIACKSLDYPAAKLRVHVLDDGPRAAVGEMAKSFGFDHLTRADHEHAKAGNLNAALPRTTGEFVMILDVDHVPVRSYLRETLGFFKDPKVAFVQTPHHFYNPDCYQKNLLLEGHIVNEQDLFFQIIQPGKNGANATIFAGSSAVFRRKALSDIGGFKTDCAIEDMHTGMELHSRGWQSVYYNRILSAALSPENFAGYLTQRRRWTKGGVQLFFLDNPLLKKGLSLRQRLYYFASLIYFFHGWMRLIYLLAPLSFLLVHYNPIVCSIPALLWYFIPHYLASHLVFSLLTREYRNPFWSDVYESATSFALSWTAFETLFRPDFLVFHVTPKGLKAARERLKWRLVLPHIILCALLIAGILKATYHFMAGGMSFDAFGLSCAWAVFNLLLLVCSIEVARERPHNRRAIRLKRSFPATLHAGGKEFAGRTLDVSLSGAMLELRERTDLPRRGMIHIVGDGDTFLAECEIRHNRWMDRKKIARVGVFFHKISPVQSHQLVRLLFSAPESWNNVERPLRDSARSFKDIIAASVRAAPQKTVAAARDQGGTLAFLIFAGARIRVQLDELGLEHAVVRWPRGFTPPAGHLFLWIPAKRGEGRLLAARAAQFLGGVDGEWSFSLAIVPSKQKPVEPVGPAPKAQQEAEEAASGAAS